MKAIEAKWFKKKASCSNRNTAGSYDTLSLDSFWGLFIVAGVASSLSLLIYVAMFLYEHGHILICVDSKASFRTRIREVLRAYDQEDKKSKKDSVQRIAAEESSPNTNCLCLRRPSRSRHPNKIVPEIVLEEEGTTCTQHSELNPNVQAPKEIECAIELTAMTETMESCYGLFEA